MRVVEWPESALPSGVFADPSTIVGRGLIAPVLMNEPILPGKLAPTEAGAVASLYAGDVATARQGFSAACASEESDEANDIKYKSYVMLGNLSHEDRDYAAAKELHDQSLRYTANENVTAQALALKALNSYALNEHDEALHLFEESLRLFNLPADGDHRFVVIMANLLHPVKDYPTFLRAAQLVRKAIPEARFVSGGVGPLTDEMRALAVQLGLERDVFFIGSCLCPYEING